MASDLIYVVAVAFKCAVVVFVFAATFAALIFGVLFIGQMISNLIDWIKERSEEDAVE